MGLRYLPDRVPGIRRRRVGRGFSYFGQDGVRIQDPETLARIRSLVIPPAWEDVWISPSPQGHLEATGRDRKGRKQYLYHLLWSQIRCQRKFDWMVEFGRVLPRIRRVTEAHLRLRGLPREKVLATAVRLLESTYIRIGNSTYARVNRSYGLTTLRCRHVDVAGSKIELEFRSKRRKPHRVAVRDRRLARVLQKCLEIPGYELFKYVDAERQRRRIDSGDVNEYLREISGDGFTAKDFRTWAGFLLTFVSLLQIGPADSRTEAQRTVVRVVKEVARSLGNRPAACRKYYIHPAILEAYEEGELIEAVESIPSSNGSQPQELEAEEAALLAFLSLHISRAAKRIP